MASTDLHGGGGGGHAFHDCKSPTRTHPRSERQEAVFGCCPLLPCRQSVHVMTSSLPVIREFLAEQKSTGFPERGRMLGLEAHLQEAVAGRLEDRLADLMMATEGRHLAMVDCLTTMVAHRLATEVSVPPLVIAQSWEEWITGEAEEEQKEADRPILRPATPHLGPPTKTQFYPQLALPPTEGSPSRGWVCAVALRRLPVVEVCWEVRGR